MLIALALAAGATLTAALSGFPVPILAGLLTVAGLLHITLLKDLRGPWQWTFALAVGITGFLSNLAVALVGITNPSKAEQIARAIIAEIQQPIDLGAKTVQIGASIGIAFVLPEGDSPEAIMSRADSAMYSAKRAGRGQVCLAPAPESPQAGAAA